MSVHAPLIDGFGRRISYVRLSVTDRCDLRCTYCMSEHPAFLPRRDLLSFDEMERLCAFLIGRGVERLRVTGGEPLVRKGIGDFLLRLGEHVHAGRLKELTLTTNGTQLEHHAERLAQAGIRRINVSCDSLQPDVFRRLTRGGDLARVLAGIEAAQGCGVRVKLNVVALAQDNRAEIPAIIAFAHQNDMAVSLIETMPLGEDVGGREDQFVSLQDVLTELKSFWTLEALDETTGGPARYHSIAETGGKIGLITPLSHNFCDTCNRVRITCTGRLYMCLGQEDHVDLRAALRDAPDADKALETAVTQALAHKPRAHDFYIAAPGMDAPLHRYSPARTMSMTGG
ncbi:GTP 3',8-cyclase MoaA [Asticcacaulis sp. EMRT-3]|uniref:GTP 3',8-cyclase MoaA n=1 Tax=Asticcacaulis sp. EMRT-3 TaxID=3040349 RepID=UPI0024AF46D4|nr:GTP 3',8-cyclase MoaA [Asticcacaulis sp. EMRT-3]MDI7775545.1 GTP 3',8-cyclase MoaA [Asticcacaulis sp. EMRT-3]